MTATGDNKYDCRHTHLSVGGAGELCVTVAVTLTTVCAHMRGGEETSGDRTVSVQATHAQEARQEVEEEVECTHRGGGLAVSCKHAWVR